MPNNREWASFVWLGVLLVWALTHRDVRSGARQIVRSASSLKIILPFLAMAGWVCAEVWLGTILRLWNWSLTTDSVIWFFSAGLVLFGNFDDASTKPHFFRRNVVAAFGIAVAVDGYSQLAVLNLPLEIVLQPILALLIGVTIVSSKKSEDLPAKKLATALLLLASVVILGRVTLTVVTGWDHLDKVAAGRQVALPMWLALGLLPYIYMLALYGAYEMAFLWVSWEARLTWRQKTRAAIVLIGSFHFKAQEIGAFSSPWGARLAATSSFSGGREVIRAFREAENDELLAEAANRDRLVRFAGVDGTDDDGHRLDQREFKETQDSLRWLSTCQMGWYANRGGCYRPDLLDKVGDDFSSQGLRKPSGILMKVSVDGQAWFAWRRTESNWCFAVGASGPPPNQWEHDGPDPPSGFPGVDPAWGSEPYSTESSKNWGVP